MLCQKKQESQTYLFSFAVKVIFQMSLYSYSYYIYTFSLKKRFLKNAALVILESISVCLYHAHQDTF